MSKDMDKAWELSQLHIKDQAAEISSLRARVAELEEPAAMYRYLRAQLPRRDYEEFPTFYIGCSGETAWGIGGEAADAAIRKAMGIK